MNWTELERGFTGADRRRVAAVTWRAAKRIAPVIARVADEYGPEALEWFNAIACSLGVTERYVTGLPVTRFTLDLAADTARTAATAGANAARLLGPSRAAEDAELAFASTAFAADVCRAHSPQRAAMFAVQGLRAADASGRIPREWLETDVALLNNGDFGDLWPIGEPDWSAEGWERLRTAGPMPALLTIPVA